MASQEEIRTGRLQKVRMLKDVGMFPYPSFVPRTMSVKEAVDRFDTLVAEKTVLSLVGRIMAIRAQGVLTFVTFTDGTASFQAFLKKDEMTEQLFDLFTQTVDMGDFVSFTGTLFTTKRGEKTVQVSTWCMATKSLLPLPEKWHGLQDADERLRLRYLDLLTRPDERELFKKKAKFWQVIREYFNKRGFLEVETPYLETTTGGAEARPFKTHHNDFDIDVFLRISVGELWQKRLMAAGFEKTFEIGRVFRNEGTSPEHLQEFTNVEFYAAYTDFRAGMDLVKDLYQTIAREVFGTTQFEVHGHTFDLAAEWKEIDYVTEIKARTGVDVLQASIEDMKGALDRLGVTYEGDNKERLTDTLWKYCRKQISGPAFLVGHPVLVAPLAKVHRDRAHTVEMFQPIIAGSEMGRGYSELNDPVDQRARFEVQQQLLASGDEEAMMPDYEFVEMLEYGMPPTCGYGFGERLFAFLAHRPIRETQLFPLVRPKKHT